MNILMLSLLYPKDELEEVRQNSRGGFIQNQINQYQYALMQGIIENLKENEHLEVINALPVGTFPTHYRRLMLKSGEYSGSIKEIGSINLPWLKQIEREYRAYKAIIEWFSQSKDNRTILLYTLYLPYMRAIVKAKRSHPELRASVVVTDLPDKYGLDTGRRGVIKWIEGRRGYESIRLCHTLDGFILLTCHMTEVLPISDKVKIVVEGIAPSSTSVPAIAESARPMVLYTGTLSRKLGILELIKAFQELPEYDLLLCGKADEDERLESDIRTEISKYPHISWLGMVPIEKARELQASASLLINPRSSQDIYTRYSFPSKTMEYLLSGRPVLCCKLDGIPDEYDAYLHYIKRADANGIKEAVRNVLTLPVDELRNQALAGRRFVMEYKNPRIQCARIVDMLRGL